MKITVKQLRRVIKEEISRVLSEAEAPQFSGVAKMWFDLMTKNSDIMQDLAGAWDAMSAAGAVAPGEIRSVSDKIAADFGLSPQAISFHLRKNPSAAGASGQQLLAAAEAKEAEKKAGREAASAKSASDSEAIAAAKTQLGIDLAKMHYAAQQADDPGAFRRDMADYEDLRSKVLAAWDPETKTFDKSKI